MQSLPKKLRKMHDLPNQEGFEFTGVYFDGSEGDCFVKKSIEGQYIVLTAHTFNRVFQQLKGWYK